MEKTIEQNIDEALQRRPRRNRQSPAIRRLVQETRLHPSDFILPLFVREGQKTEEPIEAMPGVSRYSSDLLLREAEKALRLGIPGVILFPVVPAAKKDAHGTEALKLDNLSNATVRLLKRELPDLCVMVDVALDPYTTHGHDGVVDEKGEVINDTTLEILSRQAIAAATAGADVVAPSDMMDGRVAYIRRALDTAGFTKVSILSYAAKYASAFYGPFREALGSAPRFGDKKGYQLNPANIREALIECDLDEREGADLLLIKPALAYLDVIAKVRERTELPIGAYHVSGEYAMVMAAAERGWLDADKALYECLIAIKRAGADFILTYAATRIASQIEHCAAHTPLQRKTR